MIKNRAGQVASRELISATDGSAFVGVVTVYVTIDAGTQTLGTVGSGIAIALGHGLYVYHPSQAETNGNSVSFTFIGAGAIPATITYDTLTR
jgi:hypothetical protein